MPKDNYDIVILGGGPGGYSAAFRARLLGLSVALVEQNKLGGTCLHNGCIPAKSLLHAAHVMEMFRRAPALGLKVRAGFDWKKVSAKKDDDVGRIYSGLQSVARARGVEIFSGFGRLESDNAVTVQTEDGPVTLNFNTAVLATGSKPRILPELEPGGPVITSDEALALTELPKSIIIVGGGYIGVEFGSLWRSFDVDVTVVEAAPRLMMQEDEEISETLAAALTERGIKLYLGAKCIDIKRGKGVSARVEGGGEAVDLKADKLLVAVGREAVTAGFSEVGVGIAGGYVEVDERLRTSRPQVYAVGDVVAGPQLAHSAFAEGIFVAEEIAGLSPELIDYWAIPHAAYSEPGVASVGLTEAEARRDGREVVVVRESFGANPRARITGDHAGKVKIVAEKDGPILGVHMIGPGVSEASAEAMLVVGWEADPADLVRFIHPHPTLSEAFGEAALKLAGKPLHTL